MRGLRLCRFPTVVLGIFLWRCVGRAQSAAPLLASSLQSDLRPFVKFDARKIALRHARIIDGTGVPAREDGAINVEDGVITGVGDSSLAISTGAAVVDLNGFTVIPGLVGMHDHLFYPGPVPSDISLPVPVTFARLYLASGVTTIRTAGSVEPYTDLETKKRIDTGRLLGPKIHVTGPFLEGPGGSNPQMHELRDATDARRTVDFWADQGVTSFKAYTDVTPDQLAAAVASAHKRGLKITGHLCSITHREAIALGIDNLEHGPLFTDSGFVHGKRRGVCPPEIDRTTAAASVQVKGPVIRDLISDLVAHKVAITSTLAVFEVQVPNRPPVDPRVLAALIPELQVDFLTLRLAFSDPRLGEAYKMPASPWVKLFASEMEFERDFVTAGGLLLAGADPTGQGGVLAGFADQREVELLVEAGFSPIEAIHIATWNGAEFLGETSTIGAIVKGKRADLVVIQGNPVEKIRQIRNVRWVFKDGVGYDSAKILESVRGVVGLR
jgi:imidazolonepropionase-like amidohydrolase